MSTRNDNTIRCRATSGVQLHISDPWVMGSSVRFIYAPAGTHTIQAGFREGSITMTLKVDAATPKRLQESFDHLTATKPKQEPYADEDHEARKATLRFPKGKVQFGWGKVNDDEGIVVSGCEPTSYGADAANGKVYRSWSPEFETNAEYHACKCSDCSKPVKTCKCASPSLVFPDGVKGSASNPAEMTGVNFVAGAMTNRPAFHQMPAIKAKEAGKDTETVQAVAPTEATETTTATDQTEQETVQATWSDAARKEAAIAREEHARNNFWEWKPEGHPYKGSSGREAEANSEKAESSSRKAHDSGDESHHKEAADHHREAMRSHVKAAMMSDSVHQNKYHAEMSDYHSKLEMHHLGAHFEKKYKVPVARATDAAPTNESTVRATPPATETTETVKADAPVTIPPKSKSDVILANIVTHREAATKSALASKRLGMGLPETQTATTRTSGAVLATLKPHRIIVQEALGKAVKVEIPITSTSILARLSRTAARRIN